MSNPQTSDVPGNPEPTIVNEIAYWHYNGVWFPSEIKAVRSRNRVNRVSKDGWSTLLANLDEKDYTIEEYRNLSADLDLESGKYLCNIEKAKFNKIIMSANSGFRG
jgi:hypothetical protein